jgi:hypothetical protein
MSKYSKEKAKLYYKENREKLILYAKKRNSLLLKEDPKKYYGNIWKRVKKWRLKNPIKNKAHKLVFVEVRAGRLKQLPCEICKKLPSQAHHNDYSKPLAVQWLCKKHHREADLKRVDLSPPPLL